MKMAWTAIRATLVLMVLCGVVYPLVTTGVAQVLFPKQADGSLMTVDGKIAGSTLLAQQVTSPVFFHPRASAASYDPTATLGSNKAVASSDYAAGIQQQIKELKQENPALKSIPADLVTTSGSGFDPDLSPDGAKAQIPRISQATGLSEDQLTELVDTVAQSRQWGLFGEPRVNVNELNLKLLELTKAGK